jgi:hypothetical protein
MNKNTPLILLISSLILILLSPQAGRSQLVLGQYEDEAPLQTWNTLGITTAASLGRGGTSFTLEKNAAASLVNPALLIKLPTFSLAVSGSYKTTALSKYAIINTGVLMTIQNLTLSLYAGDFAGASIRIRGWAFSVSAGFLEDYSRPSVSWEYTPQGHRLYYIKFEQKGHLINTNLSLAKKITDWLAVGLGLNLVQGKHEKHVEEKWPQSEISISDDQTHDLQGTYVNGGLLLDLSEKLAVAAVFRTPYEREASSESLYRWLNLNTDVDIKIDASEESVFKQPLVLGMGVHYRILESLLLAGDVSFFNWSNYRVDYFGETRRRDFTNVIKINAGLEYTSTHMLFNLNVNVPFRAGIIFDPQPMNNPDSYYLGYTLGLGLQFRNFYLDMGYLSAREHGSGHNLTAQKILLTLSFQI